MSEFLTNPIEQVEQEASNEIKDLAENVATLKSAVQLCKQNGDEAFIALMQSLL